MVLLPLPLPLLTDAKVDEDSLAGSIVSRIIDDLPDVDDDAECFLRSGALTELNG